MTRNQMILTGLLAIQVILLLLLGGPLATPTGPAERRPLLAELQEFEPAKLEVLGSEEATKVTLVRQGEAWTIEEAGGYPAQTDKVDKLLTTLEELQVRRPVVTSSRYHDALKVTDEEHERRLRLWDDPAGDPAIDLYLGTSPNYRTIHVRRRGEDPVYQVSGLGAYDVRDTSGGWIDTKLLSIELKNVSGFKVENANGTFELEKMADGEWRLVSPSRSLELDRAQVESLVRSAASLNAAEPAGPIDRAAQGFDGGGATVTLRVVEEADEAAEAEETAEEGAGEEGSEEPAPQVREIKVWVGDVVADKDTQRYVAHSGFDYAARVWKGSVDKLLETKLADLEKKKEETPAAEG